MPRVLGWGSWCFALVALLAAVACGGKAAESQVAGAGGAVAAGGAPSSGGSPAPTTTIGGIPPEPPCSLYCVPTTHWDHDAGLCLPDDASAPPPNAGECATAADCNSSLPHSCLMCPDGTMACAHHECVDGACEVATCEPAPVPPATICGDCYVPCPGGWLCAISDNKFTGVCFDQGFK
jgi:hypothetical protein